jgi:hypothetical protein
VGLPAKKAKEELKMSEYQYYEFQAIDRPLTVQEQAEINQLSSRVQLTPNRAVFLYNYGDFRHSPEKVLTKYFDMMFYIANWGTWQLMFRFPKALVDPNWFQPYELPDIITITQTSEYVILDIVVNEEGGIDGWVEGEVWLPQLLPLRDDLLQGDLRLLYLVWLRMAPFLGEGGEEADPVEPPLPANLKQLSQPLQAFIELVEIDCDLVAAAAQISPDDRTSSAKSLENFLPALSEHEKQEFLLKLLRGETHVNRQLINRLRELVGTERSTPKFIPGKRRFSELTELADRLGREREQNEQNAARKKRIAELEKLAPKAAKTWERAIELIGLKQAKSYDEAISLLIDLRDLARHQKRLPEFSQRLEQLKLDYSNRSALIKRLKSIDV